MSEDRFAEIRQFEQGTSSNKIIEIRSVFKDGKHTVQPAFDTKSGWYAGVDRISEEEKKTRKYYITVGAVKDEARHNTKLKLENGYVFDLNKEIDAINWKWVQHLPCIAMSFDEAQMGKALFYVHIEGKEAEATNKRTEAKYEAMKLVMDDATTNYENRALLMGMDMESEAPAVIKEFLLDTANKNPSEIIRVYRGKDMKIKLLYVQAVKKGTVVVNPDDNVVKFGGTILGYSEESAVAYLKENEDLLDLLTRDVNPGYFAAKQDLSRETPIEKARRIKEEGAEKN
jgi:hypothetical protein